jgi:hypothetical protein
MINTIDTIDWMGDWMDKVFEDELNEEMFKTIEEAKQTKSFDFLEGC